MVIVQIATVKGMREPWSSQVSTYIYNIYTQAFLIRRIYSNLSRHFFLFKLTEYFSWELDSGIQSCNSTATRCVPNVLTFQN